MSAITLATIRREAPDWTWRTERYGRARWYVGTKGARTVTVYSVGVITGEDSYGVEWRRGV